MEESQDVMETPPTSSQPDSDNDYIVLKKSTVLAIGVALAAFISGSIAGYVFGNATAATRLAGEVAAAGAAGQQQAAAPQPAAPAARLEDVNADDDAFIGAADAPVTIVEFSDYECPFCKRFRDDTLDALLEQYGDDIKFVYRDFPLSTIHPDAQKAAEAAECVREIEGDDAYWDMHDAMFAGQVSLGLGVDALIGYATDLGVDEQDISTCLEEGRYEDEVLADLQEGQSYGVTGTPTFFINGVRLVGAQPLTAFQAIIDQELNQ